MRTILLQPYSLDRSHLSPAHSSTVVVKDMYCVQSPDIEEDEEAGGDRAEHPIANTTLATIAMIARIRDASGFLDTKVAGYMRDAPILTNRVHTYDEGGDIFHRLPPEILTEILVLLPSASVRLALQEWNKGGVQRLVNPLSNELRDCYAYRDLAKSNTVFPAMHTRNHTGNDKYFPVLYRQPHIKLNNRGHNDLFKNSKARLLPLTMQCSYDLGPILGSSSSETLRFHGKDNYANLIHDRRMSMLDAAHTSTGSVVTLKHGPCTMDDTLNQREATNIIDSKPESKRLLRYFEPSGSEFLQMTLFRDQHVSVMNGETPQEWQKTLPTAIGSKFTCGPQDLKNFPLDHFMRQIEARYKSLEHQIQMLHQKLVMASPMSPTGLSFGEFTEGLPIHGSNKTRANPATHTINEEGRDRHVLHNGGALSMDDLVETNGQDYNGQDYNTARDRKLGSHSPEPKNFGMINKDQRRSTRATVPVSPRRLTFTPRRSAPTLIHPNDGKAMISSANIYKSIKVSLFAYPGSSSHRKLRRTGGNVHFPARRREQRKGRRKPEVRTSTVSGLFLPTFRFP